MDAILNKKFGLLTVISRSDKKTKHYSVYFHCLCDCGKMVERAKRDLFNQDMPSCGCQTKIKLSKLATKHGQAHTDLYTIWEGIIQRCCNPKNRAYKIYGNRGISVINSWKIFSNFYNDIIASIGNRPSKMHSIDRKDNNGNYEPGNVKWSTRKEQQNNARNNIMLSHNGVSITAHQAADLLNLSYHAIANRKTAGWSDDRILNTPIQINAKIDLRRAEEIRQLYNFGNRDKKALAKKFGISRQSINDIIAYRTWKLPS